MTLISQTKPESWAISELEKGLSGSPDAKRRLELPKFQRAIVWSKKKQQELIESLRSGFPIGSLLVFEGSTDGSGAKTFLLVDGLQRTTAIKNYLTEPLSFLDLQGLDSEALVEFENELKMALSGSASRSQIGEAVEIWMRETRKLEAAAGFDGHALISSILRHLDAPEGFQPPPSVYKAAGSLLDFIRGHSDIRQISLPVIVYEGDEGHLPYIFEKINTAGTQLSRFDVFAASWINQTTSVENQEIRKAVEQKYEQAIQQGFEVSGLEGKPADRSYSLWEYLFGLGKILSRSAPELFGAETKDATMLEPEGFTLATVAHGHRMAEMKDLPSFFAKQGGKIDPASFEAAAVTATKEAAAILAPFLTVRLNRRSELPSPVHTEYQIASIVAILIASRYDPHTFAERDGWKARWKQLKTTVPQHYLLDVIRQVWRGSGDTRLFETVWTEAETGLVPSDHYFRRINKVEWDQALDLWFSDQMQRVHRTRAPVRSVDKLFLKFVYADKVSVYRDKAEEFDLEHLFPVGRLRKLIGKHDQGWPISSVANLALFPAGLNRGKGEKTLEEYLKTLRAAPAKKQRSLVSPFLFCRVESVRIPRRAGMDLLKRDEYEKFLKRRFSRMKAQLYRTLQISS